MVKVKNMIAVLMMVCIVNGASAGDSSKDTNANTKKVVVGSAKIAAGLAAMGSALLSWGSPHNHRAMTLMARRLTASCSAAHALWIMYEGIIPYDEIRRSDDRDAVKFLSGLFGSAMLAFAGNCLHIELCKPSISDSDAISILLNYLGTFTLSGRLLVDGLGDIRSVVHKER